MSYIECPDCGQKALSVATRCPRCGHNYPPQSVWSQASTPAPRRRLALLPIAGAVGAGVVLVAVLGRSIGPRTTTPAGQVPAAEPAQAVRELPSPLPGPAPPVAAAGSRTEPARRPLPPTAPSPGPESSATRQIRRYARTWVNVREQRARAAAAVRVLRPGEAVVVDSLRRGWYRVLAGGAAVGYVHRSNLDSGPPSTQR